MGSVENISSSFVCMVTRVNLDSSISCLQYMYDICGKQVE